MASTIGIGTSLLGAGMSLYNMFGNKNKPGNVQMPPQWNMLGMNQAAAGAMGGINDLQKFNTWDMGGAQGVTDNLMNNPWANMGKEGAGTAGQMGQYGALTQFGQGQGLYGQSQGLFNGANSIMNTGFDPQNALYDRTHQQIQEQQRAGQAARGIAMTPHGAGLEDQANRNFNLDWQDRQLGRQTQAGQAASGMMGQGTNMVGQGAAMSAAAPGQYYASSFMPYNAYQGIERDKMGALGAMGQFGQNASQLTQTQIDDYLKYIGAGNQAGQVANQNARLGLEQQQMGWNQNRQMGMDFGNAMGQLGRYWPNGTSMPQWNTGMGFPGGPFGGWG